MGRHPVLLAMVAVLVSVAAFLPALGGKFLFDDTLLIAGNPGVHSLSGAWGWFTGEMWQLSLEGVKHVQHYYRPIVMLSFAMDWSIGAGNPVVFHITNLVLHGCVVALAYCAALRWSGSVAQAVVVALLFGAHAAKVENVAWISGRTDVMSALGILLVAYGIALRGRYSEPSGRVLGTARMGLAAGLEIGGTLLAYLSKELAVVLPIVALFEVWQLGPALALDWKSLRQVMKRWPLWVPQAVAAGGYLLLRRMLLPFGSVTGLPASDHARYILESLGRAVALTVWPDDLSYYAASIRRVDGQMQHAVGFELIGASFVLGLVLLLVFGRRRLGGTLVGLLVFVGCLAPTLNIVFTMLGVLFSPRFLYLPQLFFAYGVVHGVAELVPSTRGRRWAAAGVVLSVALLLVGRTWQHSGIFVSNQAWRAYELKHNPDVPDLLVGVVGDDRARGEKTLARLRAQCGFEHGVQSFGFSTTPGQLLFNALSLHTEALTDAQRPSLSAVAAFFEAAANGQGSLRLSGEFEVHLSGAPVAASWFVRSKGKVLLRASQLRLRTGEFEKARVDHELAMAACPDCRDVLETGKKVERLLVEHASAATFDQASRQAAKFVGYRFWGVALDVLRPHLKEILERGSDDLVVVAKIASMAGDEALATEVMARLPAPLREQVRRTTTQPPELYRQEELGGFVDGGCALESELW